MAIDVPIRCGCGTLRGTARALSGGAGNRLICYCDDCQAFAHFLGDPGRVLDPYGGSDIFQTSPARLELEAGLDQLQCVRLSAGGIYRWFAGCCRTIRSKLLQINALRWRPQGHATTLTV